MWRGAILLLALSAGADAEDDPSQGGMCRNGLFPTEGPFSQAQVVGAGQLRFLEDMGGCPEKGAACGSRGYVVEGDQVLTSKIQGAYTCAFYPSKGGGTAGWVESKRLHPLRVDPDPAVGAWIGKWVAEGGSELNIRRRDGKFEMGGEAYWPSPNPSIEERPGGPNLGYIKGPLRISGNRADYADNHCEIGLTLVGEMLVVGDNRQCGGMNVSFSSIYKRISLQPDDCDALDYIDGSARCDASGKPLNRR